jgi:hypothetical protein
MKFLRIVFLVILIMGLNYSQQFSNGILLTNESSSVVPNGLFLYENDNLGISIESPVNWKIVEETNSISFSPYNDSLFGPHVTIRIRNSDSNESFGHYLKNYVIDSDKERYQNFRIINDYGDVSLGGYPAYMVYFSYTEPYMDTFSARNQLEFGTIIESNRVYTIYYDADVNDYSTYLINAEQMIHSFKILSFSVPSIS